MACKRRTSARVEKSGTWRGPPGRGYPNRSAALAAAGLREQALVLIVRLGWALAVAPAAVLGLLAAGAVPDADARTQCSYGAGPPGELAVTATGNSEAVIRRRGEEIDVREFLGRQRNCGAVATVFGTDSINVRIRGLAGAELRLDGGPFGPGATPETEGVPEIEVEFRGAFAVALVTGTPGADELHWGAGGAHPGLNLNPLSAGDRDVDVTVKGLGSFLVASGARGNDTIVPSPGWAGSGDVAYSDGGPGNDLLIAPTKRGGILEGGPGADQLISGRAGDLLQGGPGSDKITGQGGMDMITGGRGSDLLSGGPGPDRINTRDESRDTVRCGAGRDRVNADRKDRLRACEAIDRS